MASKHELRGMAGMLAHLSGTTDDVADLSLAWGMVSGTVGSHASAGSPHSRGHAPVFGSALGTAAGGLGQSIDRLKPALPTLAALYLDRRASAHSVARSMGAAQLNPACVPSGYPRTRALRLELLLRSTVHFHTCCEFVRACIAVDTKRSRLTASQTVRALHRNVMAALDMAAALTDICVRAEDDRAARLHVAQEQAATSSAASVSSSRDGVAPASVSASTAGSNTLLLDDRFVACCREGLHHAVLAGASMACAMLELGLPPASALEISTASLRLFGLPVPWQPGTALSLRRRALPQSPASVGDALRLDLALACVRKAVGLSLVACGYAKEGKQQLMGARLLFDSTGHPEAAASVHLALGLYNADRGELGTARQCLERAVSTFRSPPPSSVARRSAQVSYANLQSLQSSQQSSQQSQQSFAKGPRAIGSSASPGRNGSGGSISSVGGSRSQALPTGNMISAEFGMPGAASAATFELGIVLSLEGTKASEAAHTLAEARRMHGELRQLQSKLERSSGMATVDSNLVASATSSVGEASVAHSGAAASAAGGSHRRDHAEPSSSSASNQPLLPQAASGGGAFSSSDATSSIVHCSAARHLAFWLPATLAPAGNIALASLPSRRRGASRLGRRVGAKASSVPAASASRNIRPTALPATVAGLGATIPLDEGAPIGTEQDNEDVVPVSHLDSSEAAVTLAGAAGVGGKQRELKMDMERRKQSARRRRAYAEQIRSDQQVT
jgi:hypothetical protein